MNRTIGWILRHMASTAALVLGTGLVLAHAQEQHWQAAPNNPSNNGPSYQPSNAPAAGNPAPAASTGPYSYQPPQTTTGQPQYPPPDTRSAAPAGSVPYGPPISADNHQAYPPNPASPGVAGPGPAAPGQPGQGQPIQGPPVRPTTPQVPFVLTQPEIDVLNRLLTDWEKRNKQINVLHSKFFRWRYDAVFGNTTQPPPADDGELKFAAPDKAWMKINPKDSKHPEQAEQWLCDGKSVFQWDYSRNVVTEFIMPPEMQGKGIGDGPLPFVFGIEAQKLKQRYYMRIITPSNVQDEVWLEAYPKFQGDAANYKKVEVILQLAGEKRTLFPFAIQVYSPNGKDRVVYQLQDPKINPRNLLPNFFAPDDWKPSIDRGWTKVTRLPESPSREAGINPAVQRR